MPLISVIVPVYNLEHYLPRCLDSILNQTYDTLEVIVVDDGSTDNSFQVISDYAAKEPRIVAVHQANSGVTAARMTGISHSRGDYIGFVDGDDEIEPDMYERLLSNAITHNAEISHCGYQMCFEDGRVNYFHNTKQKLVMNSAQSLSELLSGQIVEPGLCNKLYSAVLIKNLLISNVMPTDIKINEDLLMNFYLFRDATYSVFEDFCPYHYIVRKTSASRQKVNQSKIYDPIKVRELILEGSSVQVQPLARQAYLSTCINVYNSIVCAKDHALNTDRKNVRQKILAAKEWEPLLSKNQQLLFKIIVLCPAIYGPVYRIYQKVFQHSVYE